VGVVPVAGSAVTNETRYLSADTPEGDFQVILPRQQDVEYDVSHHPGTNTSSSGSGKGSKKAAAGGKAGGWLVITLRDKGRPNSEVLVAPLANPQQQEVGVAGWVGWDQPAAGGGWLDGPGTGKGGAGVVGVGRLVECGHVPRPGQQLAMPAKRHARRRPTPGHDVHYTGKMPLISPMMDAVSCCTL
jgi:hypothetical protein